MKNRLNPRSEIVKRDKRRYSLEKNLFKTMVGEEKKALPQQDEETHHRMGHLKMVESVNMEEPEEVDEIEEQDEYFK